MQKMKLICLVILSLIFFAKLTSAQELRTFRYTPALFETHKYVIEATSNINSKYSGDEIESSDLSSEIHYEFSLSKTPVFIDDIGGVHYRIIFDSIHIAEKTIENLTEEIEWEYFSSNNRMKEYETITLSLYEYLINRPIFARISSQGRLFDFYGFEDKVDDAMLDMGYEEYLDLRTTLHSTYKNDSHLDELSSLFFEFPVQQIEPNGSWELLRKSTLLDIPLEIHSRFNSEKISESEIDIRGTVNFKLMEEFEEEEVINKVKKSLFTLAIRVIYDFEKSIIKSIERNTLSDIEIDFVSKLDSSVVNYKLNRNSEVKIKKVND